MPYWWHASGTPAAVGGAVNAVATPTTAVAIGAVPTATKLAAAQTLIHLTPVVSLQVLGQTSIAVTWADIDGARTYDIERNGVIVVASHPNTTLNDTGLSPGTSYRYRVRAKP